jgi:DNA N-6-adenine-methyltransferase (Dam)
MNTAFERDAQKEEWLTPRHIIEALAPFDLDPCASVIQPWPTAAKTYTIHDNGLIKEWKGFVWCNPPYGNQTQHWFKRLAEHGNGIALTFARTETRMFFDCVWKKADAILFLKGRLSFCDTAGKAGGTAGAPSVLIAYGATAVHRLKQAVELDLLEGQFIQIK